jgi:Holliday junction resolvase RusA-like endonuclease
MHIIIEGRIPSKKNSKVIVCRGRFPRVLPSKAYQEWHKEQSLRIGKWEKADGCEMPFKRVSMVEIIFTMPDKRACDLTNKAESIMDLLVDVGILADDSWQVVPQVLLRASGVDPKYPVAEIVITP